MKSCLWLVLCLFALSVEAQQQDLQARMGLELSTKLSKNMSLELFAGQRWDHNLSTADKSLLQPSLSYEFFDFMRVGAAYRMSWVYTYNENTRFHQRFHVDLSMKHRFDRVKVRYRSRVQYGFYDYNATSNFLSNALVHRAKLEVNYTPFGSRFTPYVALDYFNQLNVHNTASHVKTRYLIGCEYNYSRYAVSAFYQIDKEVNIVNPLTKFILGLKLGYAF